MKMPLVGIRSVRSGKVRQQGSDIPSPLSSPSPAIKTRAAVKGRTRNASSYRVLRTRFCHNGFHYRQIAREGDAAIYEQASDTGTVTYEVIRIRKRDGFSIGSKWIAPAELYPRGHAWGVDGWTVLDRDVAFRKMKEILHEIENPHDCESADSQSSPAIGEESEELCES